MYNYLEQIEHKKKSQKNILAASLPRPLMYQQNMQKRSDIVKSQEPVFSILNN